MSFRFTVVSALASIALVACGPQSNSRLKSDGGGGLDLSLFPSLLSDAPQDVLSKICGPYNWSDYIRQKYGDIAGHEIGPFEDCAGYREAMLSVWPKIHPVLTSNPNVERILFNRDLQSNGITLESADGSVIILNPILLRDDLEAIDNKKIQVMFGQRVSARYTIPSKNQYDSLRYVLTHELAHVLDNTFRYTVSGSFGAAHFDHFSWMWSTGSKLDASTFPNRPRMRFRRQEQSLESDAPAIMAEWEQSDFPTLYAAMTAQEDFAETFAQFLFQREGWTFEYQVDGRPIGLNDRFSHQRFAGKKCFVEGLLGEQRDCHEASNWMTTATTVGSVVARFEPVSKSVVRFMGGTGYFITSRHLITNFHVIRDDCPLRGDACPSTTVARALGVPSGGLNVKTVLSRADMDFAVVEMSGLPNDVVPAKVNVAWDCDTHAMEPVFSLGFPEFADRQWRLFATLGRFVGHCNADTLSSKKALYSIASAPGASGSPIFNASGEIVAMLQGTYGREKWITGSTLKGIEDRTGIISVVNGIEREDLEKVRQAEAVQLEADVDLTLSKTLNGVKTIAGHLGSSRDAEEPFNPDDLPKFEDRQKAQIATADALGGQVLFGELATSLIQNALDDGGADKVSARCENLARKISVFLDSALSTTGMKRNELLDFIGSGLESVRPILERVHCQLLP